jgi:hypothetical protein
MLKLYADESCTISIQQVLAQLNASGGETSFGCPEEPDELRLFNNTHFYGKLLNPSTEWSYLNNTITLTDLPLSSGDIIIAVKGDKKIFEDQYMVNNDVTQLSIEMPLWVKADSAGDNYRDAFVTFVDLLDSVGADSSWYQLAADVGGSAGTYQSAGADYDLGDFELGVLSPSDVIKKFWIKASIVEDQAKNNYRDVLLRVQGNAEANN